MLQLADRFLRPRRGLAFLLDTDISFKRNAASIPAAARFPPASGAGGGGLNLTERCVS